MKKLLIFDLDGTLADTIDSIRHAVNLALSHFGYPERSYDEVRMAIGNGASALIKGVLPQDISDNREIISETLAYYEKMYDTTYIEADRCYDGMEEALDRLREKGYMIAVLSNKQDRYVKLITEQILKKGMASIVMGQTVGLPKKPDPTVPLMIAEKLGFTADNTAFIGDSEVDVETAKNAGMISVGCSWGYRGRDVLVSHGADHIIDSPIQLTEIFQ